MFGRDITFGTIKLQATFLISEPRHRVFGPKLETSSRVVQISEVFTIVHKYFKFIFILAASCPTDQ